MSPIQVWMSVFFTLAIYSLLYKDNKVFRFAEHTLVAVTAANGIVLTYHNYIRPTIVVDLGRDHKYIYIVPLLIGALVYTRFYTPGAWLSRIPMSLWLGVGAGYILTRTPALFLSQVQATFLSLKDLNNIVFVLGVITVTAYFYFTLRSKNPVYLGASTVGKIFLLVAFGAAFANTVMARISLLLGRLQFLLQTWLGLGLK